MQHGGPVAIEREPAGLRTVRSITTPQNSSSPYPDSDLPIPRPHQGVPHDSSDTNDDIDNASDSSHLFWLPAHLHPELAPAEFRAFLQDHTSSVPAATENPGAALARSISGGSSLGRKKSMLSRQYKPSANDGVEIESDNVIPTRRRTRTTSNMSSNLTPHLSASDLQQLEFLADEAARSGDPSKLRSVLKRSLSVNQTSVIDQMDDISGDNADVPIIIPTPSQSLKRSVRTKIRKASLQGDGGGHRFPATRRGKVFAAAPDHYIAAHERHSSNTTSESEHADSVFGLQTTSPPETILESEERSWDRPQSYSEESAIYDSYADRAQPISQMVDNDDVALAYAYPNQTVSQTTTDHGSQQYYEPPLTLEHPSPRHHLDVPSTSQPLTRSPSPGSVSETHTDASPYPATTPSPNGKRKEQKKTSLFGKPKWGSEKNDTKPKKDKPSKGGLKATEKPSSAEAAREKEKETGFFGSLFGGNKKKQEESPVGPGTSPGTAAAFLGQSRSSKTSAMSPDYGANFGYARYPIHVERAVYRLSHIKLANPRRPLYEQVLISNLMFWYLGVINKSTATPAAPASVPLTTPAPSAESKEELEQQEAERHERDSQTRQAIDREQREPESPRRESGSPRKTLNKGTPGVQSGGSRRAEVPVKAPSYGVGMVMDHEPEYEPQGSVPRPSAPLGHSHPSYESYDHNNREPQQRSTASSPPEQHARPQIVSPPPVSQSYPEQEAYYYEQESYGQQDLGSNRGNPRPPPPPITRQPPKSPSSSLPPGAMPPVSGDHSWMAQAQFGAAASASRGPPTRLMTTSENSTISPEQYYQQSPQYNQKPQRQYTMPSNAKQDDSRQQRSPPQQQQPASPPPRLRSQPSSSRSPVPSSRPSTAPPPEAPGKLQGRSLSASAAVTGGQSRRSQSPPPSQSGGRSRSRPRESTAPAVSPPLPYSSGAGIRAVRPENGRQWSSASREEEDLPLALYQQQHQQQHLQYRPEVAQQQQYVQSGEQFASINPSNWSSYSRQ